MGSLDPSLLRKDGPWLGGGRKRRLPRNKKRKRKGKPSKRYCAKPSFPVLFVVLHPCGQGRKLFFSPKFVVPSSFRIQALKVPFCRGTAASFFVARYAGLCASPVRCTHVAGSENTSNGLGNAGVSKLSRAWRGCQDALEDTVNRHVNTGFFEHSIENHDGDGELPLLQQRDWLACHRLLSEKVTWPHVRANRPILVPSVPVLGRIEIRHGCQFISSLVRALAKLPGGLGKILPCGVGSHMSRLRHLGWNQCSHGLTSRPLESCHHQCLKAVCGVLVIPEGQLWSFWMAP